MVPRFPFPESLYFANCIPRGMGRNVTVVTGEGNEEHFGEAGGRLNNLEPSRSTLPLRS